MKFRIFVTEPAIASRQSGAALFVALVVIVLVSLLGVSTMKRGSMAEQMGAGHYQSQIALQASESAVESTIGDIGIMQLARLASAATASENVNLSVSGVVAQVTYSFLGNRPAYGWSLDSTGQGASRFVITSLATIPSTGVSTTTQHGVYRINPPTGD